jgi:hypothetical protein
VKTPALAHGPSPYHPSRFPIYTTLRMYKRRIQNINLTNRRKKNFNGKALSSSASCSRTPAHLPAPHSVAQAWYVHAPEAAPQYVSAPHTVCGSDTASAGMVYVVAGTVGAAASFADSSARFGIVVGRCMSLRGCGVVFGVRSRSAVVVGSGRSGMFAVGSGGGRKPSLRG